ncbi:MAG: flavodoxin [Ruminococcaceae bacterium]|nr:flavodoxin [Oscillospiraceae bacterium]
MNIQVRFYTRSGNTQKLADAIAREIGVKAESVAVPLTEKADILFLGCSYYAFDVDESIKSFIAENSQYIGKIVCFGTSAMMKSVHKPMKKVAAQAGVAIAAEDFHCRGEFKAFHKGRPDENDLKNAAEFARKFIK